MGIVRLLAGRIAAAVALLVVASFITFSLIYLSPGSIVTTLLGNTSPTPAQIAAITAQYHLNDPFFVQYFHWLGNAAAGNFGNSLVSGTPALGYIREFTTVSIELGLFTLLIVLIIGIPVGLTAGIRRSSRFDRGSSLAAIVGMSAPPFAVAIALIYVFGVVLDWLPVYGAGDAGSSRLVHLVLPAVSMSVFLLAIVVRQTRAAAFTVNNQDYVTFAKARGLGSLRIATHYLLRNTAVPVVTSTGLVLVFLISGTLLIETVFSLQGLGALMLQSVTKRDIPVVQALTLLIALFVVVVNLACDLVVLAIDPRTRHQGGR